MRYRNYWEACTRACGGWQLGTIAGELGYVFMVMVGAAADMANLSVVVRLLACTKSTQRLTGPPTIHALLLHTQSDECHAALHC